MTRVNRIEIAKDVMQMYDIAGGTRTLTADQRSRIRHLAHDVISLIDESANDICDSPAAPTLAEVMRKYDVNRRMGESDLVDELLIRLQRVPRHAGYGIESWGDMRRIVHEWVKRLDGETL